MIHNHAPRTRSNGRRAAAVTSTRGRHARLAKAAPPGEDDSPEPPRRSCELVIVEGTPPMLALEAPFTKLECRIEDRPWVPTGRGSWCARHVLPC